MSTSKKNSFDSITPAESSIDLSSPAAAAILEKPTPTQGRINAAQTDEDTPEETKTSVKKQTKKKTKPKKKFVHLSANVPEELAKEFDAIIEALNNKDDVLGKVNRNLLLNKFVSDFVKESKK